jgi:hypothetical protein
MFKRNIYVDDNPKMPEGKLSSVALNFRRTTNSRVSGSQIAKQEFTQNLWLLVPNYFPILYSGGLSLLADFVLSESRVSQV